MTLSEKRLAKVKEIELTHENQLQLARNLKDRGYANRAIAHILRISESSVRQLLEPKKEQ